MVGEVVGTQTHAEVGIGLDPHLRVVPLRFIVERIDDAEQRIVLVYTAQHFDDILPIGIAGSRLIEARRRDDEHQRLPPCAESRLDDVEHSAILVGVELVDNAATRVQTVVRAVIGRERFHRTAFEFIDDRISVWRKVVFQVGRLDDLHRIRKAYLRLILDRRGRVDLRAALAVGEKHIQPDAGRQCGFAVLACDLDISVSKAARAVGILPPEDIPQYELLPRLQSEPLSCPLALGMFEFLDKVNSAHCGFLIEIPTFVERTVEVGIVTLDGKADILADENSAGAYLLGIKFGGIFFDSSHIAISTLSPRTRRNRLSAYYPKAKPPRGCDWQASIRTRQPVPWHWRAPIPQPCAWG